MRTNLIFYPLVMLIGLVGCQKAEEPPAEEKVEEAPAEEKKEEAATAEASDEEKPGG